MGKQVQIIEFHGDELVAVEINGKPYVAVKPICEMIGLNWSGQFTRIKNDAILSKAVCQGQIPLVSNGQESICLPLDMIHGWLFSVSEKSIKDPAIRERLILYKRECYAALYQHFHGKQQVPQVIDAPAPAENLLGEHTDVSTKLRAVDICRMVNGTTNAQRLWNNLGLQCGVSEIVHLPAPQYQYAMFEEA